MNNIELLIESAKAFKELLNYQYEIKLGRKGVLYDINLVFFKKNYLHLSGLDKIIAKSIFNEYPNIYESIINKNLKLLKIIISNKYFYKIFSRLNSIILLRNNFYNPTKNKHYQFVMNTYKTFTNIEYDFLLKCSSDLGWCYYFLRQNANSIKSNEYVVVSTFIENNKDYSLGQSYMHLLYKKEINVNSSNTIIIYDKAISNKI